MLQAILLDSREPSEVQQMDFGCPTSITMLETGDLWASCADGNLVVIERKTPNDFLASIGDNRLFLQAAKMRARSPWAYLVVTGWLTPSHDGKVIVNGRVTGWSWNSVQGALLTVQEYGVHIAYCDSDHAYVKTVKQLAERTRGEHVLSPVNTARIMTPGEQLLCGLPGIGLERAQDLLADMTPAQALTWLTWLDTVSQVAGIGNGIKHNVRKALKLAEGETLTLWNDEALTYLQAVRKEKSNGNGNGNQAATAVEPNHLADDHGNRAGDEGLPVVWGGDGSASRGDYGQRF
jgi:ERCC4-type nuclease